MTNEPALQRLLYILAFDHRRSFEKAFFRITGTPTAEVKARMVDAKHLIFEGFLQGMGRAALPQTAGILVDEEFGSSIAREATRRGIAFAMPVEKSGQAEFDFEFGEEFGAHIEMFDPTYAKALVRYNPEGDPVLNRRQGQRLARLTKWLHDRGRQLMFELLIPAEPGQLKRLGGDVGRYQRELLPELMRGAIRQLHACGVEPDVWKIEGLERKEDCWEVAKVARSNGRVDVGCVVLGRGADTGAVKRWLKAGAGVPGYFGFAIGRTIWWEPLKNHLERGLSREQAAEQIATNYVQMIRIYQET